jgi:hypothetical protein
MRFVIEMAVLALVLPLLIGWVTNLELRTTFEPAFFAAVLLVPYYLLMGLLQWVGRGIRRMVFRRSATAMAAMLLVGLVTAGAAGQENSPTGLDDLIDLLDPAPIELPADAVIIPYDSAAGDGVDSAERILVPYEQYAQLWNKAYPDQPLEGRPRPTDFAYAGALYSATLVDGDDLLIRGSLRLESYLDKAQQVPLPLAAGVLTQATLDGQRATLTVVQPAARPAARQQQAMPPPAALVMLTIQGKGTHQLDLEIRFPVQRSGGWHIVRGRLPSAPASRLELSVPRPQTEVRLTAVPDQDFVETEQADQTISTTLAADGGLQLQWRGKVSVGQVDRRLTAQSMALFDVQEDGMRLTWRTTLEFPNSQRDTFALTLPLGYLLERVSGENVRGWRVEAGPDGQQLDITLLKAATGNETITVHLARYGAVGQETWDEFAVPSVVIPEAVLHQGQLAIRRSPLIDLRTAQAQAISRATMNDAQMEQLVSEIDQESPLGIRPFQSYRFTATPFGLQLSAKAYQPRLFVEVQSLLRIGELESNYEARLQADIQDRSLLRLECLLPEGLQLEEVICAAPFQQTETERDGRTLLTIAFDDVQMGALTIDRRGTFAFQAGSEPIAAPRLEVLDAQRQQGYLVLQADPAYDVRVSNLENCETVLLERVQGWLQGEQRRLARTALAFRNPNFSATINTTPRQPQVTALTITNIRVTPREIQQSVYVEYTIRRAGVREVSLLLPEELKDARVTVPMLREKIIEPIEGNQQVFRLRLLLQDEMMGQLIVLIHKDRDLTAESHFAPIPQIENARLEARYVVLESAGRDEVVVEQATGLEPLNRQQSKWRRLTEILHTNITEAFLVREDAGEASLSFITQQRDTVETAGARIRLARTTLVVDGNGTYRALQEYRVDNKIEQFLDVQLPAGAQLWTVRVADEPAKPTIVPDAPDSRRVRIPLFKTAAGDLDYPVQLKFGGQLRRFSALEKVDFPLPQTVNINVELSQVRLHLPETRRWFDFGGSLSRVQSEEDLQAGYLSYQTKQIRELTQMLTSSKNTFGRVRAANNLKQLGLAVHSYQDGRSQTTSSEFRKQLLSNASAWQEAERQLETGVIEESLIVADDNRGLLKLRYDNQSNDRSKNVVNQLGANFDAPQPQTAADGEGEEQNRFNSLWFRESQLGDVAEKELKKFSQSRIADQPAKAPQRGKRSLLIGQEVRGEVAAGEKGKAAEALRQDLKRLVEQQQTFEAEPQAQANELQQQVERYQQKLESRSSQSQAAQADDLFGEPALGQVVTSGLALGTQARGQPARGAGSGGFGGGGFGFMDGSVALELPATGLASLEIKIPERGVVYRFTKPRGDLELNARSVDAGQVERGRRLLEIFVVLLVILAILSVLRYLSQKLGRRIQAVSLVLLGLVSLVSGVFMIAGLALLVVGVTLFFVPIRPQ